jgi:methyl-accepting chemotaxis protein
MNFNGMKVSSRLALAFGAVLTVVIVTSAFTIDKLAGIEQSLEHVVLVNNEKVALNNNMISSTHVVARVMRTIVLMEDKAEMDAEMPKVAKARELYDQAWGKLTKMPPSGEAGMTLRQDIAKAGESARLLNNKVIELGLANKAQEATTLMLKEAGPATTKWQDLLEQNVVLQEQGNKAEFEEAQKYYQQTRNSLIAAGAISILLSALAGWLVTRSITRQLGGEPGDATHLAQAVAEGNLTTAVVLRIGDSNSLMAQLKTMQERLVGVVGGVRTGSESLSLASAEIAQGNQDLSSRTESQASALQETAASMEQLSSTVKQNADNARQANQLAMNASLVATKGGDVVAQVVSTMKDINESSRRISDIISVIDGIAFQTNILALNAAVEAARAGEQGRGFAVVATEVRSLAGRSAEAAKQIKSLISASVEQVEAGTTLVDEAGTTMGEVVTAVKRVTDLMGEISTASAEQSAGVTQIGEAVMQMDQVTQQNAALVEEMAAAASALKSQAHDLVESVSAFNIGAAQITVAPIKQVKVRSAVVGEFNGGERRAVPLAKKVGHGHRTPVRSTHQHKAVEGPGEGANASSADWESF